MYNFFPPWFKETSHSKEECHKQLMKQFDFANQFTLEPAQIVEFTKQSTVEVHTIQGEFTKQKQREVEGGVKNYPRENDIKASTLLDQKKESIFKKQFARRK